MISVIICCRHNELLKDQVQNIEDTIGCDHELVVIDNHDGHHDIFSAYNEGVRRSHGDILHFRHDDITHITHDWGKEVEKILSDPTIGLLGVVGSHVMPGFPAYYSESPYMSGHNRDNDNGIIIGNDFGYWDKHGIADVAVVDGQQFFIPKRLFPPLQFDEERFSGFHGYDMDISLQVQSLGLRVVVSNRVLSVHQWCNSKWNDSTMLRQLYVAMDIVYDKWKGSLPIIRGIDKPQAEIDNMMLLWNDAYRYRTVLKSKAYQLGHRLLSPVRRILH